MQIENAPGVLGLSVNRYLLGLSLSINGVAAVSRIVKNLGLCCKRALYKRQCSAKETYKLIEPTDRSHPILTYKQTYV